MEHDIQKHKEKLEIYVNSGGWIGRNRQVTSMHRGFVPKHQSVVIYMWLHLTQSIYSMKWDLGNKSPGQSLPWVCVTHGDPMTKETFLLQQGRGKPRFLGIHGLPE